VVRWRWESQEGFRVVEVDGQHEKRKEEVGEADVRKSERESESGNRERERVRVSENIRVR
jgi:hypothetical protein